MMIKMENQLWYEQLNDLMRIIVDLRLENIFKLFKSIYLQINFFLFKSAAT